MILISGQKAFLFLEKSYFLENFSLQIASFFLHWTQKEVPLCEWTSVICAYKDHKVPCHQLVTLNIYLNLMSRFLTRLL